MEVSKWKEYDTKQNLALHKEIKNTQNVISKCKLK